MRTLLKLTSQCDLKTIARKIYPLDCQIDLFRTWVKYEDDPTTQRLFAYRMEAHNPHDNMWTCGNDPHTLQGLSNKLEELQPDSHLIIDGVHLLASNIMLRSNSDEDSTEEVAADLLERELAILQVFQHANLHGITILSADIQADHSLSTFQGTTYQRLLALTNRLTIQFFNPDRVYTALSAGFIREL